MFATVIEQDREIKKLFYQKIKEKEEKEKQKHLKKVRDNFFLGWLLEPIADVAYTWRRASEKEQGSSGESVVSRALRFWLPRDAIIINDVVLEVEPDVFIQIDHLVLNRNGIFVLETKTWDGAYLGSNNKWKMKVGNKWVDCKSPTKQNERHVKLLRKWLMENLPDVYEGIKNFVYPIVVFKRAKWVRAKYCDMPVVNGGMEAVGEINKIKGENISEEEIKAIVNAVKNARPLDREEWKERHNRKEEKNQKNYEVTTGKTSNGKTYVRVIGKKEDAQRVAEEYKRQNYTVSQIMQDKRNKDAWYFYYY